MPRRSRLAPLLVSLALLGLLPGTPNAEAGARRAPVVGEPDPSRAGAVPSAVGGHAARRSAQDGRGSLPAIPDLGDGESLLARVERSIAVTSRPGGGRTIGALPASSRYYGEPLVAWVRRVSADGRFGLVSVPYVAGTPAGWLSLRGLELTTTDLALEVDRSSHVLVVRRDGAVILRAPAGTGATSSPTPTGSYFVTDRVAFGRGGAFGTFAFGLSGIQPDLPAGWFGGDQLAIHGTDDPRAIGTSSSAGCVRVSERVLDRLRPLLRPGTPVVIAR